MRLAIDFAMPRGGAGFKNLIDGSERNGVALGHRAALPRMPVANESLVYPSFRSLGRSGNGKIPIIKSGHRKQLLESLATDGDHNQCSIAETGTPAFAGFASMARSMSARALVLANVWAVPVLPVIDSGRFSPLFSSYELCVQRDFAFTVAFGRRSDRLEGWR